MKKFKNWRTLSFILWIALTIITLTTMPDVDQLIKEKGQIEIPNSEQSAQADKILKKMDEGENTYHIISVFYSGNDKELTKQQQEEINAVIKELKRQKEQLGIKELLSHQDSKELENQLFSKDKTTILTQISVDTSQGNITEVAESLEAILNKADNVQAYLTGSDLIATDFVNSTQEGVKKTEVIAIVFILIVLVIVFRSPIVPIVSLLTVGISYLVSWGFLTHLVDKFNFPFSDFTQVFIIVVLFGVGTDYNILLYTRFKEELSLQDNSYAAVKATFKSAGKTVLYSGLAVLIGFASLILAEFKLYQATSGVAIAVAFLLLVLVTLNPFFMALLGKKMFYPVKSFKGHGDSKVWGFLSKSSIARPVISVILILGIAIPFMLSYSNSLNFNDLWEVGDEYGSKKGINIIEDHFPAGFSSPASLAIESAEKLDTASTLQILDELAEKISKIDGVSQVLAPTRPTGDKIKELYINEQTKILNDGIDDADNGIGEINEGLSSASDELKNNDTSGLDDVQALIDGTDKVKAGVSSLRVALTELSSGINDGAAGAQQIKNGLVTLQANMDTLSDSTSQLYHGYHQLAEGLSSYEEHFSGFSVAIESIKGGFQQIEALMGNLIEEQPELMNNTNVQQTLGIATEAQQQLEHLSVQLQELTKQHGLVMAAFRQANDSLLEINNGFHQMKSGVEELHVGAASLEQGLIEGANGSGQISTNTVELESGVTQINNGQKQLLSGLNELQDQMAQLQSGLSDSTDGLRKVNDGLSDAQDYLYKLSKSDSSEKFYIPQEILDGNEFQESLDTYMSKNRKIATMSIILDVNPYAQEAMPIIDDINKIVEVTLSGTDLKDAQAAIGGTTAINADLKDISQADFIKTATIMLIGIALVLLVITKSIVHTIYIVGSLVLVYFASMGISEWIISTFLDVNILSWNVPFFSFIMIVALGVDYSIFIMMRYIELEGTPQQKIMEATRHMGGVVLSAALILGGTFAALIPSGVLTLIEVATVVIIGLVLLSFIAMPVLLPALISLTQKLTKNK
ncbi:MMPL family transporter [Lysinibacillus sp. FSL K6-0232]|uniref:MMPL family transporter n=1 Tax=Lysinibacillus sp. FSL K6-0232 TaxID=2921425 RepID=UPI0030F51D1E